MAQNNTYVGLMLKFFILFSITFESISVCELTEVTKALGRIRCTPKWI